MRGIVYNCGACPYLPEREFHAFHPVPNPPTELPYRLLMDHRFRRSGGHLYLPVCPGCDSCQPIRVDAVAFMARDDQRRCLRRNRDLTVTWHERGFDAERADLYQRYQTMVHAKEPEADGGTFLSEDGGIAGGELHARDANGRLVAVSVLDRFDDALSSVYCYYDPTQPRRSLGTFMVLSEINHCRKNRLGWLYLGFLVRGCAKMEYKARYKPHEVLEGGIWVRYDD
jgi:arginine-tRNA-protein transferase